MRQSHEDIVEEDPHRWHGQGLHMGTLRKGDRWSLSPMGKGMRKKKARRHLPGDCLGHEHRAGHIPGTCKELGLSADMQLQCGLIEHVCIAGSVCACPESTFTGKAIDGLGHPPGLRPAFPEEVVLLRHLPERPQSTLIPSNIHPQKPKPSGSPKAEQKENTSCRQHRKNPGFLFELGQVLEAVSNTGVACGGGFSQWLRSLTSSCLQGMRGPVGVWIAASTCAGHRPGDIKAS